MARSRGNKHIKEIEKMLPAGWSVQPAGGQGTHWVVVRPDGQPARKKGGIQITIANTPSDRRSLKNDLATLRREGVI